MMKKKIVDSSFISIKHNFKKSLNISRNLFHFNIYSIIKFGFLKSNTPKIIKVIKDEDNGNKIIYKDFDENELVNDYFKTKDKEPVIKNEIVNKLKIFGNSNIVENYSFDDKSEKLNNKKDKFNIFDNIDNDRNDESNNDSKEEIRDNLLNYNSFFSDYCRVYVKAGDGGNGSISVLKGPMFDQSRFLYLKIS